VSDVIRVAIVSDLHAFEKDEGITPSHLNIKQPRKETGRHPISGLIALIKEFSLTADLLLCPGDLGDKASQSGIEHAWRSVHEVAKELQATVVVGTAGNHDLDSRYKTATYDPEEFLRQLTPGFPLPDDGLNRDYWANHFAVMEHPSYRLVTLNSCAYHGGAENEKNYGRVTDSSIEELRRELEKRPVKPINILMCHHHPQQHVEIEVTDYGAMIGGQRLIHILESQNVGEWIIVHGHIHHPKIEYAQGTGDSPVILSAGSLCAVIYKTLQTLARNEFHLLTFSLEEIKRYGLVGRVKSWDWAFGEGWAASRPGSGLPYQSGFGFRTDLRSLAQEIAALLPAVAYMDWAELVHLRPQIDFLIPQDQTKLFRNLRANHKIGVLYLDGAPRQIARTP
jgi:hypothetical protein